MDMSVNSMWSDGDAAASVNEYTFYLTLEGVNACVGEGETLVSFKKGLLMLSLMQGMREQGFILDSENLEILLVGRATEDGKMRDLEGVTEPSTTPHLAVYVPPSRADIVNWRVAAGGGRVFEPRSLMVLLKLFFAQGDLPVGTCLKSHLNLVCRTLNNALLAEDNVMHRQLRPIADLIVVGLNQQPVGYRDSAAYTAAQAYRRQAEGTNEKMLATHSKAVDALHSLKALQAQMIRSIKAGGGGGGGGSSNNDLLDLKKEYRHMEKGVLAATYQDMTNAKACMEEDMLNATTSCKESGDRQEVAEATDVVHNMQGSTVLKLFKGAPYPSEELETLRGIHQEIVQSAFEKAAGAPVPTSPRAAYAAQTADADEVANEGWKRASSVRTRRYEVTREGMLAALSVAALAAAAPCPGAEDGTADACLDRARGWADAQEYGHADACAAAALRKRGAPPRVTLEATCLRADVSRRRGASGETAFKLYERCLAWLEKAVPRDHGRMGLNAFYAADMVRKHGVSRKTAGGVSRESPFAKHFAGTLAGDYGVEEAEEEAAWRGRRAAELYYTAAGYFAGLREVEGEGGDTTGTPGGVTRGRYGMGAAFNSIGNALENTDPHAAARAFEEAIAHNPTQGESATNLGSVYQRLGLRGKAGAAYLKGHHAAPQRADCLEKLLLFAYDGGVDVDGVCPAVVTARPLPHPSSKTQKQYKRLPDVSVPIKRRVAAQELQRLLLSVKQDVAVALCAVHLDGGSAGLPALFHSIKQLPVAVDAGMVVYNVGTHLMDVTDSAGLALRQSLWYFRRAAALLECDDVIASDADDADGGGPDAATRRQYCAYLHNNAGNVHEKLHDDGAAGEAYRAALRYVEPYASAQTNLASLIGRHGDVDEAVRLLRAVIAREPGFGEAHNNLASLLATRGRVAEAFEHHEAATRRLGDAALLGVLNLAHTAKRLCRWRDAVGTRVSLRHHLAAVAAVGGRRSAARDAIAGVRMLHLLSHEGLDDDLLAAVLSRRAGVMAADAASALDYTHFGGGADRDDGQMCPAAAVETTRTPTHVGLVGSDFRHHPVGYVLLGALRAMPAAGARAEAGLTSSTVNLTCFFTSPKGHDAVTAVLRERSCDGFIDVHAASIAGGTPHNRGEGGGGAGIVGAPAVLARSPAAAAQDVLVDLNGNTNDGGEAFFAGVSRARAPARARGGGPTDAADNARAFDPTPHTPITVGYLGYPASYGPNMDYFVGDPAALPPHRAAREGFAERLAYVCPSVLVGSGVARAPGLLDDDDVDWETIKTTLPAALPTRDKVMCNFGQHYKITPEAWGSWMNVLTRVEDAVLALTDWEEAGAGTGADATGSKQNLLREAAVHGVADRVLFLPFFAAAEYRVVHGELCGVAVDTFDYNGHVSSVDALFTATPIVTLEGGNFRSRITASLLRSIGLDALIATHMRAYENLCVSLLSDGGLQLQAHARRIRRARDHGEGVFDERTWQDTFNFALRAAHRLARDGRKATVMSDACLRHSDTGSS